LVQRSQPTSSPHPRPTGPSWTTPVGTRERESTQTLNRDVVASRIDIDTDVGMSQHSGCHTGRPRTRERIQHNTTRPGTQRDTATSELGRPNRRVPSGRAWTGDPPHIPVNPATRSCEPVIGRQCQQEQHLVPLTQPVTHTLRTGVRFHSHHRIA
jgi:hypothetical protein